VLNLYATRREADAAISMDAVIQRVLRQNLGDNLDYYTEYLDVARFSDREYQAFLRDFLKQKYAKQQIEVVIASSDSDVEFIRDFGDELFPGAAVVFSATGPVRPRARSTGVILKINMSRTLDLAMQLQPETRRVFVASGASAFDKYYLDVFRSQLSAFEKRLAFTYLVGLPMPELLTRVACCWLLLLMAL
jgi:hypothetical protein